MFLPAGSWRPHVPYKHLLPGLSELILQVFPVTVPDSGKWPVSNQNKNAVSSAHEIKFTFPVSHKVMLMCGFFPQYVFLLFVRTHPPLCSYNMKVQQKFTQMDYYMSLIALIEFYGECNHNLPDMIVDLLDGITACVDSFLYSSLYLTTLSSLRFL